MTADTPDNNGPDVPPKGQVGERIEFLTFEDVCAIHDRGLAEFGFGEPGFLNEHSVRSAAAQPEAGIAGRHFYKFPAGMAAACLYYLTNQQGFVNGNKRAAVGSALEFLARNGYRLDASNLEIYQMTIRLAGEDVKTDSQTAVDQIETWIEDHLLPME
jgi:death-on-curing protein